MSPLGVKKNLVIARDYLYRAAIGTERALGLKTMVSRKPLVKKAGRLEKILFVGPKFNDRGTLDFDYINFYKTFEKMGYDTSIFDYGPGQERITRANANEEFVSAVRKEEPDMVFTTNYSEKLLPMRTIERLSFETRIVTCNFNSDDIGTFEFLDRFWANKHNWILTPERRALENYAARGFGNVILTQYGFNPEFFYKESVPKEYEISFTGSPTASSFRERMLGKLKGEGFPLTVLSHEHNMREVINKSRINLNFSGLARAPHLRHMKARVFEVTGAGGFLLTERTPNLEEYFDIGREVEDFKDERELKEKIRYYLENESERERIALAGYTRAQKEHTYEKRMNDAIALMFPGGKE